MRMARNPLSRLRQRAGYETAAAAAKALGVSTSWLHQVERGAQSPGPRLLDAMCDLYRVRLALILDAWDIARRRLARNLREAV